VLLCIRYRSLNWFITYQGCGLARICLDCATPVPPAAKIQLPDLRACQLAPKVGTLALRFPFGLVPACGSPGLKEPISGSLDQSLQQILVPHRKTDPFSEICPHCLTAPWAEAVIGAQRSAEPLCGWRLVAGGCSQGKLRLRCLLCRARPALPWDPLRLSRAD